MSEQLCIDGGACHLEPLCGTACRHIKYLAQNFACSIASAKFNPALWANIKRAGAQGNINAQIVIERGSP